MTTSSNIKVFEIGDLVEINYDIFDLENESGIVYNLNGCVVLKTPNYSYNGSLIFFYDVNDNNVNEILEYAEKIKKFSKLYYDSKGKEGCELFSNKCDEEHGYIKKIFSKTHTIFNNSHYEQMFVEKIENGMVYIENNILPYPMDILKLNEIYMKYTEKLGRKCRIKIYSGTTGGENHAYVHARSKEEAHEYFIQSDYFKGRVLPIEYVGEVNLRIGEVFGEYY